MRGSKWANLEEFNFADVQFLRQKFRPFGPSHPRKEKEKLFILKQT